MFEDFSESPTAKQSAKRFGSSVGIAAAVYIGLGAAVVAASATVKQIVEEKETQVEFAPAPEPEPEPEPPPPAPEPQKAAPARKLVKRAELKPPDKVSDEKLKESDKELAAATEGGPTDGFLTGTPDGKGSAPPPPPPPPPPKPAGPTTPAAPLMSASDMKPAYPPSAKRKGIEGTVVVAFDIMENGSCANPQILSGPPEFSETVLRAVKGWRFKPALRDGKPIRTRVKKSIVFRLEDA
jgi:protein TonB